MIYIYTKNMNARYLVTTLCPLEVSMNALRVSHHKVQRPLYTVNTCR